MKFALSILFKKVSKENCFDTNNEGKDDSEDSCNWYYQSPEACGMFDDDDFKAHEMCCACKNQKGSFGEKY